MDNIYVPKNRKNKKRKIVIRQSILINQPKEKVWDFTQDYNNRSSWDKTVIKATVLAYEPDRIVEMYMKGGTKMTFVYKLDQRPDKTSLVAKEIYSAILLGAGGSWNYENHNGQTLWTQTNSVELKDSFLLTMISPLVKRYFAWRTKQSMKNAKKILEK